MDCEFLYYFVIYCTLEKEKCHFLANSATSLIGDYF